MTIITDIIPANDIIYQLMNKAFLFDMDGVIIDSEREWAKLGNSFLIELFGQDIAEKMGSLLGITLDMTYDRAVSFGFSMDKKTYYEIFDAKAAENYSNSAITEGLELLGVELLAMDFKLGLVSASRQKWIDTVLSRVSFSDSFEHIISINDRPDLTPKPHPSGYLEAMSKLNASPPTTIILEDSNTGIAAGKAAGATVIGFKANLLPGYKQEGADVYAENIEDVIKIVKDFI